MPATGNISPEAQAAISDAIENVPEHGPAQAAFGGEPVSLEDVGYTVQRNERGQFIKAEAPPENNLTVEQVIEPETAQAIVSPTKIEEPASEANTEEPSEDVSKYVSFAKDFDAGWNGDARDRAALMANLFKGMAADEQGKFLQTLTGSAQQVSDIPADYEPVNAAEAFIVQNKEAIKSLPQFQAFQQDVTDVVGNHRDNLNYHLARLEVAERNVAAIAELLNVALPKTDVAKIKDAISNGKDASSLLKAHEADLKKAIDQKKQAVKERPAQAQSEGAPQTSKPGENLLDFLRRERANGRVPVA